MTKVEKPESKSKVIMNLAEASEYTGLSKSTLYKLIHYRKISYSKPNGKLVYFFKEDIDSYLSGNRFKSEKELDQEASNYLVNGKRLAS